MAAPVIENTIVEIKCENIENDVHAAGVLKRIENLRYNDQLCDVVLVAENDDKRISAHRLILAGSSEYFSAMFTGSLRESRENEVILKDISGDILEILVHYCYTGSLKLQKETVDVIIKNADKMQLHSAVEICCKFFIRYLQPDNCIEVMLFAFQMNFPTLYDASFEFVSRNFIEVSTTKEFLMLEAEMLIKIISRDDLNTPSEEYVFDSVKKWIEYHPETRREITNKLLSNIRLTQLSPEFIIDNIEPICRSVDGKTLVIEALTYHFLPCRNCSFAIGHFRVRSGYRHLMAIYQQGSVKVAELNNIKSKWCERSYRSISETLFGVTAMNDQIIFAGGKTYNSSFGTQQGASHTVFCYDCINNEYTSPYKSMISPRYDHAMIAHNNSVYLVGGKNGSGQFLRTVEKLNSKSGNWSSCAPMQTPRAKAAIDIIDSQLYIVGGVGMTGSLSSVECLSTKTNKWRKIAPMNTPRSRPGVAAVNGLLYAFGGCDDGKFFERYDPSTDKWTMCPSKMVCTGDTWCAAIGNSIYVSSNSTIKEYHVVNNTWKTVCYPITTTSEATSVILLTISSVSNQRNCK